MFAFKDFASQHPVKLRFENTSNKKNAQTSLDVIIITTIKGFCFATSSKAPL
ncbi:MAG: hypothetical protein RL259_81 [Bacteroidota bacterium]|jgi:hypothetical protein